MGRTNNKVGAKRTYIREVVIENCKIDFGMGPGVIATDEITYTDKRGWGWNHPMILGSMLDDDKTLIESVVFVRKTIKK